MEKMFVAPLALVGFLLTLLGSPGQTVTDIFAQYGPREPFAPRQISETLQAVAGQQVPPRIVTIFYDRAFKSKPISDQNFYIDLLATAEVMAQAWSANSRKGPTVEGYKAMLCVYSLPLPGCRPKSRSNREKILRVREGLVIGAYASEAKREQIRSQLTPKFLGLPNLEDIELVVTDIEEFIDIRDLLQRFR